MVNNFQFISMQEVISRCLRHPLMSDLNLETAIQFVIDFIGLMGLPPTYLDKYEEVEIDNYRGLLPCDLISINQVRWKKNGICMRYMTDNFNEHSEKDNGEPTFKTQGRMIYTSFKCGVVEVSYRAIPVDKDGLPLIPDEPTFLRALELYIKKQWFTILFDMGKISPAVLQNTQQEYAFAAGACNNTFIIPSVSEMESITNMMNQLIPRFNEFKKGFKHLGDKEYWRIQ